MKTSFGAMTGRERLCFVLKYLFMALCVVVALFPIIWVILSSFKTNAEILSNGISLPTHFGFDGYKSALDMAPIFKFFGNSVIVTCCATVLNVLVFAMAGYAFARFRFPCDKLLYMLLSLSLVIPMTALLQPVYSVVNNLGLYDTKAGLILVNTALNMPMSLLILRGAFQSIPKAIEEAAYIDGVGLPAHVLPDHDAVRQGRSYERSCAVLPQYMERIYVLPDPDQQRKRTHAAAVAQLLYQPVQL